MRQGLKGRGLEDLLETERRLGSLYCKITNISYTKTLLYALSGNLFPLSEPSTITPQKKTRLVVEDPMLSARCRGLSSSLVGGRGTSFRGDM